MSQKAYSEFTQKILWWLNLRWVGLAMIGFLFFKLFYGLPAVFSNYVFTALVFSYLLSFIIWVLIKTDLIKSDGVLLVLSDLIFLTDLILIFWIGNLIFPRAEELRFVPLPQLINSAAFLYFLVIIASGVILGLTESILLTSLAVIFFLIQKNYFVPPAWFSGPSSFSGLEVAVFFYFGVFLEGFLSFQAENKKLELDETNFELSQKIKDLEGHRKELIQLEKKASLHQLAVSLNHEINNPLTSILGNAQFFLEQFEKNPRILPQSFNESVYDSLIESKKIKELLRKIRKISEPIVSEYIPGIKMIDIDRAIEG